MRRRGGTHTPLHPSGIGDPLTAAWCQFNPWPGSGFECSDEATIVAFAAALDGADGIKCTVRWPRGTPTCRGRGIVEPARSMNRLLLEAKQSGEESAPPPSEVGKQCQPTKANANRGLRMWLRNG